MIERWRRSMGRTVAGVLLVGAGVDLSAAGTKRKSPVSIQASSRI